MTFPIDVPWKTAIDIFTNNDEKPSSYEDHFHQPSGDSAADLIYQAFYQDVMEYDEGMLGMLKTLVNLGLE